MLTYLITGGTGTLGQALAKRLRGTIRIYSRDEYKQQKMRSWTGKNFRFFIGDVRDKNRLDYAMQDVDIVIHTAALKQIDVGEYNPFEFVKTNVMGTQNVIECALNHNVKQVLLVSTDKAVNPVNLYGATKLTAEKLIIAANNHKGKKDTVFKFVRYGNVWGSRGSVLDRWTKEDMFNVRDPNATRFHLTQDEAVDVVLNAIKSDKIQNIPKLKAYGLLDLANAYSSFSKKNYKIGNGLLKGEKLHESLDYGYSSDKAERLSSRELECLVSDYLNQK